MRAPLNRLVVETLSGWARVCNRPLEGFPVAVWGGGPGLTREVVLDLYPYPAIMVNNAGFIGPPGVVVACDKRWWQWHGAATRPRHLCFGTAVTLTDAAQGVHVMKKDRDGLLSVSPDTLAGKNSGHAAINLAVHLGARRIYLAGFDMTFRGGRSHWHEGHAIPSSQANYEERFRPELVQLVERAAALGVDISAVTPSSAQIPHTPLETAVKDLAHAAERLDHAQA